MEWYIKSIANWVSNDKIAMVGIVTIGVYYCVKEVSRTAFEYFKMKDELERFKLVTHSGSNTECGGAE